MTSLFLKSRLGSFRDGMSCSLRGDEVPEPVGPQPQRQERQSQQPNRTTGDPGRQQRDDQLRHHDTGGDDQVGVAAGPHRHHCASQRQHGGIGQMEQHGTRDIRQQPPIKQDGARFGEMLGTTTKARAVILEPGETFDIP